MSESRAIVSEGPDGNIGGNDAVGLTMDPDAIESALYGADEVAIETIHAPSADDQSTPAEPVAPAGETTPQVIAETVTEAATETPAAAAAVEATGPAAGDRILPARIGTGQFSPTTQRAMALMHSLNNGKPEGEGAYTLSKCLAMVEDADAAEASSSTPAASAEPSPADILRNEVAELEAQITEAGDNEALFGPDVARRVIELGKKQAALAKLEAKSEVQQSTKHEANVSKRESVKQAVLSEFKGADDTSTILGSRVATLIEEMRNPAHPDHQRLNQEDAPRFVVETAAKQVAAKLTELGITAEQAMATLRVSAPAATPAQPAQPLPVAGNKQVTVATGSSGIGGPTSPPTEAQVLAAAVEDPDLYDKALGYGTSFRIGG